MNLQCAGTIMLVLSEVAHRPKRDMPQRTLGSGKIYLDPFATPTSAPFLCYHLSNILVAAEVQGPKSHSEQLPLA